jgi:tetratricopeptide (TPR) repeat protein
MLLFAGCFTLATSLVRWHQQWAGARAQSNSLLETVLGESRRLFSNHFFTQADVYFHSGYYPSMFDQAARPSATYVETAGRGTSPKLPETEGHHEEHDGEHDHDDEHHHHDGEEHHHDGEGHEDAHERAMAFLGQPRDWIDRFSRYFYPSRHQHLDNPGEAREILPWLRFAAELDPQKVQTYTVAAYWLREHLKRVDEAEQFLREGWRVNPDSYEILFELGRLFDEARHDPQRARNVWELALRKWEKRWANAREKDEEKDRFALEQILGHLARLEEREGNVTKAVEYLRKLKEVSPHPEAIQKQIEELTKTAKP